MKENNKQEKNEEKKSKEIINKDNNISLNTTSSEQKNDIKIDLFIEKICNNLSIKYQLYISGKRLYYLSQEGEILYFLIELTEETDTNPFDESILIDIQFIPKRKPLLKFKQDFFVHSFCDNRNFFECFVRNDYIYNNDLNGVEKIMDEIVHKGIKNFLFCLKDNLQFNTFIFYGEYELNNFYDMNDFLSNPNISKFYRVNDIIDSEISEKYLIFTQLYFLVFMPKESDKSFGKLIFQEKLHDINFSLKKYHDKKLKKSLIKLILQLINTPLDNSYEIDFFFVNRVCPINIDIYSEENENENNNNITEEQKEEKFFEENFKNLKEIIDKKQKEINLGKYSSVIRRYKPLFHSQNYEIKKLNEIEVKNKIIDFEKLFQFCEKGFNYYNKLTKSEKEKYKDRIEFYLIGINFLGAELMAFYDKEKTNFNFYYDKIKNILSENEKNQ